jgi:ClpX C4-type zinc finger
MADHERMEVRPLIAQLWGQLMRERRWNLAMLTGVLGGLIARERGEPSEELGRFWVSKAAEEMQGPTAPTREDQLSCSFCTRRAPDVRLVAGAHGAICESCAETVNDAFKAHRAP